jgi:hypothetical protein
VLASSLGVVILPPVSPSEAGPSSAEGGNCNTPSVTMAMAHLCTNDCDHMWKKLKEKSIRILETMY